MFKFPIICIHNWMQISLFSYSHLTYHLQICNPMFPPQKLLEFWSHSSKHIVEIHDNMNKWIYNTNKSSMTSWIVFASTPGNHWHDSMMIKMQERYLIIFLSKHKENRIQKFSEFSNEIDITSTCFLKFKSNWLEKLNK